MTRYLCKMGNRGKGDIVKAAILVAALMAGSAAGAEEARFDFVLRGFTAGTLSFAGEGAPGGAYAVAGKLRTAGLAALVKTMRYDAKARGTITAAGAYKAQSYSEDADTGRRQSQAQITWSGGVPQVTRSASTREAKPWDIAPESQPGTVDPLTAMFAVLRDQPEGAACSQDLRLFDGRRATRVTTGKPQKQGETVVCTGEYRRVAGFSPDDMAEKTRFPFTLTLEPAGNGMLRVTEVAMETLYGRARLVRN